MGYGKAKYGSEQKFQKTGKPGKGPGDNIFRIMPAMHSLADEGKWAVYYTTHWGYAGVAKDATKTVVRPFRCIEDRDFRTKFVRQSCPECDNFRAKEAEADAYEAELKKQGLDEKAIKNDPDMKAFNDWLSAHAPERKWYINVMYRDRTFGDYKINHKTHKKGIDAKIAELMENNEIDATDLDSGVWFNIKRLGDGFTVPDVVEVVMKAGEKKGSFEIELAALTPEEQAKGLDACRDLSTLGGAQLTERQIQQLVDSDGTPEAVDEIFGDAGRTAPAKQVSRKVQNDDRDEEDAPPPSNKSVSKAVEDVGKALGKFTEAVKSTVAPASKPAPTITPEMKAKAEAILAKKKADAEAKAAAEKAAAEAAAASEGAPAANPMNMSDEDFLAFFNSQQP